MTTTTTLSSKGQLVIPTAVRRALHLRPGDRLRVSVEGGRLVKGAQFLPDTLPGTVLPPLQSANDVSDAYFVALAEATRLRLATLDDDLCRKPWAARIAVNPLRSR